MAESIIPYSRILGDDDGRIEKAKKSIQELGKVLEETATKLEGRLQVVHINDTKGVRELYAESIKLKSAKEALIKSKNPQ